LCLIFFFFGLQKLCEILQGGETHLAV
jgi:hypothetical protein